MRTSSWRVRPRGLVYGGNIVILSSLISVTEGTQGGTRAPDDLHRGARGIPADGAGLPARRSASRTPQSGWTRGCVSREAWRKAGDTGLLGWQVPEEYGGLGIKDFRYSVVIAEEIAASGDRQGIALGLHNDIVAPYLIDLTTEEQRRRWLPGFVTGEKHGRHRHVRARRRLRPQQVKATARRDGDHYVLNGTKTFISNGILADLVIVVARTDPGAGHRGMSLLVVEDGIRGIRAGAQAGQDRQPGPGHRGTVLPRRPRPGREPARRGGPGLLPPDAQPARRNGSASPCTRWPTRTGRSR